MQPEPSQLSAADNARGGFCVERGKHDRASRQQALMDAAMQVFAEHGYDAATTREVAEHSGCSEGLIHRYFGGKRGLLLAILHAKTETLTEQMQRDLPDAASLEDELRQLLRGPLDYIWEHRDFMRVCVSRAAIDPEVGRVFGDHLERKRTAVIGAKLRRHQAAGRIRPDIDVDAVAHLIGGMNLTTGFFAQVVFGADRAAVQRIVDDAASALLRGIAADGGETERREA